VHENESIYLPIGSTHRLANPAKIDLELIEVQTAVILERTISCVLRMTSTESDRILSGRLQTQVHQRIATARAAAK
jgi:hypothetical protein